ncbi:MAG: response regulator transcription factor [Pseudomonadota bacterium]
MSVSMRVLVAHESEQRRSTIAELLRQDARLQLVGPVADLVALRARVAEGGVEVLLVSRALLRGQLGACSALMPCVVLCDESSPLAISQTLQAGARGCLIEPLDDVDLVTAVAAVHAGQHYLGPVAAAVVAALYRNGTPPELATLTEREQQVLVALASGLDRAGIATSLGLRLRTISEYLRRIKHKLGVRSEAALTKVAIRAGLVPLVDRR